MFKSDNNSLIMNFKKIKKLNLWNYIEKQSFHTYSCDAGYDLERKCFYVLWDIILYNQR
jgi:hypothetical protein